jgi:hypothetical protein
LDHDPLHECLGLLLRADRLLTTDAADGMHAARLAFVIDGICESYGVQPSPLQAQSERADHDPIETDANKSSGLPGSPP